MALKKLLKAAHDAQQPPQHFESADPAHGAGGGHDESNWLVSYADMMTLLCGFFILLFSMAKMDEPKYEKFKEAVSKQFGGDYKSPQQDMAKFVTEMIQEAGVEKQTVVKSDSRGVSVAFQSTIFFDTLSAEVKPEGKKILTQLITDLSQRQHKEGKDYQIVVEGHTDSRPVTAGTFHSNWELSGARASRVVRMFLDERFAPDHLTAIGYADARPEVNARRTDGSLDEELLAKNRRVVLRILNPGTDAIPLPQTEVVTAAPPAAAPVAAPVPGQAVAPAQVEAAQPKPVTPAPAAAAATAVTAAPAAPPQPVVAPVAPRAPASAK